MWQKESLVTIVIGGYTLAYSVTRSAMLLSSFLYGVTFYFGVPVWSDWSLGRTKLIRVGEERIGMGWNEPVKCEPYEM